MQMKKNIILICGILLINSCRMPSDPLGEIKIIKHLDTIILASPKTNIEQSIGRILRQEEKDRKIIPLVIDIVDDFCLFSKQALKRAKFYTKNNYKIETFNNYNEPIENHYIKKKKQKASELEFLDDSE